MLGSCKQCHAPQDDVNYVFCNYKHQWLYWQIKEKMNHLFTKSSDSHLCNWQPNDESMPICNRDYLAHTAAARCESCNKCNTCNIVDNLLLCDSCAENVKSKHFDLIAQSRILDATIRKAQDFHNAPTIAIIELKKAILEDSSIINKDEAIKLEILTRYEHLSIALFETENKVYEMQVEKSVLSHELDNLAHLIRTEERERIKIADANYVPPVKVAKTVKAKLAKNGTTEKEKFEKGITDLANMHNISNTEARLMVIAWYNKTGKKLPE